MELNEFFHIQKEKKSEVRLKGNINPALVKGMTRFVIFHFLTFHLHFSFEFSFANANIKPPDVLGPIDKNYKMNYSILKEIKRIKFASQSRKKSHSFELKPQLRIEDEPSDRRSESILK